MYRSSPIKKNSIVSTGKMKRSIFNLNLMNDQQPFYYSKISKDVFSALFLLLLVDSQS